MEINYNGNKLYRGIFWIKDIDNYNDSIVIKEECDYNGNFLYALNDKLISKTSIEFNHANAWRTLDKRITNGKRFNYFPRGRVHIRSGKAIIYVNANLAKDDFILWVKKEFNLTKSNGIKSTKLKIDMSNHYLCHIDYSK